MFGGVIQAAGVAAVVHDNEHLFVLRQDAQQLRIGLHADVLHAGAAQCVKQRGRVGCQLAYVLQAFVETVFGLHGGLGGGAQHHRAAVIARQLFYRLHNRAQQVQRQQLRFVENNHAA